MKRRTAIKATNMCSRAVETGAPLRQKPATGTEQPRPHLPACCRRRIGRRPLLSKRGADVVRPQLSDWIHPVLRDRQVVQVVQHRSTVHLPIGKGSWSLQK